MKTVYDVTRDKYLIKWKKGIDVAAVEALCENYGDNERMDSDVLGTFDTFEEAREFAKSVVCRSELGIDINEHSHRILFKQLRVNEVVLDDEDHMVDEDNDCILYGPNFEALVEAICETLETQEQTESTGGTKMKYELTNETKTLENGTTVYRIRALMDIPNPHRTVKKGDLGGWVESEKNLSQGDGFPDVYGAWVDCEACVVGNAIVGGKALVAGHSIVRDSARVDGDAIISADAVICGNAHVTEGAIIDGFASVGGNAKIGGNALVDKKARVDGYAKVDGDAYITYNAHVSGTACVGGKSVISKDAALDGEFQYVTISPLENGRTATFYRSLNQEILVTTGSSLEATQPTLEAWLSFMQEKATTPKEASVFHATADFVKAVIEGH